jgi:uncharacterized protein (TIGR01777 family)
MVQANGEVAPPARGRIMLAGGSGFIGSALAPRLVEAGYDVTILTRGPSREAGRIRHVNWDARTLGPWATELDGAAAIVNLVGRSVDCRKTAANRKVILESRVDSVRALGAACRQVARPPSVWVQSATAHIHGDPPGDTIITDDSPLGTGFAPDVGRAWEAALAEAAPPSRRTVVLRISFVLGRNGGALRTLAGLTRWFLGGAAGSGKQWISWIHESDLIAIIQRALTNPHIQGTYLTTAPQPVTNAQFMRELRRALGRPWSPPVPTPIVRLGAWMMRSDPELALLGRRCVPERLLNEGISFEFQSLRESLTDLVRNSNR